MSRKWIKELREKQTVAERYMVYRKSLPVSRGGQIYLSLLLGDKSGKMEARVWNDGEAVGALFDLYDVVQVEGRTVRHQDQLQLHIKTLKKVDRAEIDPADFLPVSKRPLQEMMDDLNEVIRSMENRHLRFLLEAVLSEEETQRGFMHSPAAKTIHHAWIGGLLEHTLSICGALEAIFRHYDRIHPGLMDRDILMAGAILHDLGKIWEIKPTGAFEYTDRGRLLGHVCLTYEHVTRRIASIPDFPRCLALHLEHLILSHHGELGFGSPKRPKTAEAWALHVADLLDVRLAWLAEQTEALSPGEWTQYQRLHDRYFWKPPREDPPPSGFFGLKQSDEADAEPEPDAKPEPEPGSGPKPFGSGERTGNEKESDRWAGGRRSKGDGGGRAVLKASLAERLAGSAITGSAIKGKK